MRYLIAKVGTNYHCNGENNNVVSGRSFKDSYISIVLALFIIYLMIVRLSIEAMAILKHSDTGII